MGCLFAFLRVSFETQKFNFDDVQFVYFFFCCLCIPDLSPLPLLLSSGFWLGQPVVVPGTGSPSPSVLFSIEPCPALVIHSLIPTSRSGSLLYRGWRQQPTEQPPLFQLLPCSVHPMCSCQTHQPSVSPVTWVTPSPTCPGTVSSPGKFRAHLSPALPLDPEFPDFHHTHAPISLGFSLPFRQLAVWIGMFWHLLTWSILVILAPPLTCCLLGHTLYFPELMAPSVKIGISPTS